MKNNHQKRTCNDCKPWFLAILTFHFIVFIFLVSTFILNGNKSIKEEREQNNMEEKSVVGKIPHIIHQSWKNVNISDRFSHWQKRWIQMHPQWQYRFWTDEDNLNLVKQYYPWFLPVYNSFPKNIMRADSARYLYMHKYGGVYADLDMEPLKTMDELFKTLNLNISNDNAVLAYMSDDYKFGDNVPNAWMASSPGHPLWLFCIAEMIKKYQVLKNQRVESITGPKMLQDAINNYLLVYQSIHKTKVLGTEKGNNRIFDLYLLRPGLIYPFDWHKKSTHNSLCHALMKSFNQENCKALFPDAFTITYWTHSW